MLFENFLISEAIKQNSYAGGRNRFHYWRTKAGSEVDLVIEGPAGLVGIEIKCSKQAAPNRSFMAQYPHAALKSVSMGNFW